MSSRCVVISIKIKSVSVQTPLKTVYYIELHVSIYIRSSSGSRLVFNPLNAELNPIFHLLALLGAHHIFYVSRIRVNTYGEVYLHYAYFFRDMFYRPIVNLRMV